MRSGHVQYVQGIQPNVPAHTTFMDLFMDTINKVGFKQTQQYLHFITLQCFVQANNM